MYHFQYCLITAASDNLTIHYDTSVTHGDAALPRSLYTVTPLTHAGSAMMEPRRGLSPLMLPKRTISM